MENEVIVIQNDDELNEVVVIEEGKSKVDYKETVETINVSGPETIHVDSEEAFPPLGEDNPELNHSRLNGRDWPNQHPIAAISGLREELDDIEKIQTVYSDKTQQANYYMWEDENPSNENRDGFFVSIVAETDKIKKCTAKDDVFGVTVAEAGFIGGLVESNKEVAKNGKYGLVVTSGLIGVRCESGVAIGDYVMPSQSGMAKKASDNCGYLVTAISFKNGVSYAIISLIVSTTHMQCIADNVANLGKRIDNAEINSTTIANVANAAYALAQGVQKDTDISIDIITSEIEQIIHDKLNQKDFNDEQSNVSKKFDEVDIDIGENAKHIEEAQNSISQVIEDAKESSKEIWDKINESDKYLESYRNIVTNVELYTVGEHSQAYNLTLKQANTAIPVGAVYVPVVGREKGQEGDDIYCNIEIYSNDCSQEFFKGYFYTWSDIGWNEIDHKAVVFYSRIIKDTPIIGSENQPYLVVTTDAVIDEGVNYEPGTLYKWTDGIWIDVAKINKNALNRTVALIKHTENEITAQVTDVKGSVAAVQAMVDENGAKSSLVASVPEQLEDYRMDEKDDEDNFTRIFADRDALSHVENPEGFYAVGTEPPYDVYKWDGSDYIETAYYSDGVHIFQIKAASIMASVNAEGKSQAFINADHINFVAQEFAIYPVDNDGNVDKEHPNFAVDEQGNVGIKGAVWASDGRIGRLQIGADGSLKTTSINKDTQEEFTSFEIKADGDASFNGNITATSGNIGGCEIIDGNLKIDSAHITSIDGKQVDVTNLDASNITTGTMQAGVIQSPNYVSGESGLKLDLTNGTADIAGKITATSGAIADYIINGKNLISGNMGMSSDTTDGAYSFWAGDTDPSLALFSVNNRGDLIANSGFIGGLKIRSNTLSANNFELQTTYSDELQTSSLMCFYDKNFNPKTIMYEDYLKTPEIICDSISGSSVSIDKPKTRKYTATIEGHNGITITIISGGELLTDQTFNVTGCNYTTLIVNKNTTGKFFYDPMFRNTNPYFINDKGNKVKTIEFNQIEDINQCLIVNTDIVPNLDKRISLGCSDVVNIYYDGSTAEFIYPDIPPDVSRKEFDSLYVDTLYAKHIGVYPNPNGLNKIPGFIVDDMFLSYLTVEDGRIVNTTQLKDEPIITSDLTKKNTISILSDKYSQLFDKLNPVSYKYNNSSSNRLHLGLVAQELKASMDEVGLTTQEFAGYCKWEEDGKETYGIRYGELIPLNIYEIQKLKKRVTELENEIKGLKGEK